MTNITKKIRVGIEGKRCRWRERNIQNTKQEIKQEDEFTEQLRKKRKQS